MKCSKWHPPRAAMVKLGVWLPKDMLAEIEREAFRLDLPLSWVIRASWKLSRQTTPARKARVA